MTQENVPAGSGLALLIVRRARDDGSRRFLEDIGGGHVLTYTELGGRVRRCRTALDAAAIAPRGRVVIDVADPIAFSAAYLGVIAAGRCAVPVNPDAPAAELERAAAAIRPTAVVSDRRNRTVGPGLAILPALATGGSAVGPRGDDAGGWSVPVEGSGSALLLTSGSTGAPKAVELTEDRLLHAARAVAGHNRLTPDDRGFNPLPLFHINAEVVALLATLTAGATLLLDRRFHRHGFWETVAEHDVTWLNLVPAILGILAEHPAPVRPRRLRFIRSASAPLPGAVRRRVEALADTNVVESYGMTEAASQITAMPLDGTGPAGSCGRPVDTDVEVRGPNGRPAPPDTIGQIWIRGPAVIDAYDGGRAADRFDAGGWLDTCDRGFLDADGYLFLAGRSDDVINRGGELLYPREIEEVLIADPGVRDAVVVGRPDPILGQVPVAYVIPVEDPNAAESTQVLPDRLSARCAAQLSRYKMPQAIHLIESLPRAATGKVQRQVLAQAEV
ncbi:MAG TPA: AMP-binding protein [Solirubrobacteraceae bacterium]|jgi:acyl-CoA synthetase (AMP-forming)/AMP-acid ligase II|nr:AMP-binding protein [Solirubrobacteraceae bacterium]